MDEYLNTEGLSLLAETAGQVFRESLEEALELTEQEDVELRELEVATVRAMKRIRQQFLRVLIEACRAKEPARYMECRCGGQTVYQRERLGTAITLMGQIQFRRAYYICEKCREGTYPLDERLGICAGGFSAALQEALAVVGVHIPFELAADLFERLTQVSISENGVRGATEQIGQQKLKRSLQPGKPMQSSCRKGPPKRHNGYMDPSTRQRCGRKRGGAIPS